MTLMTWQGTDRIVYTAAFGAVTQCDIGVASHGPGPSLSLPTKIWVLPTRAQLRVNASGNAFPGTIRCEYGPTAYGQTSPPQALTSTIISPGPAFTFTLEGLAENTQYYARFVAETDRGITVSPLTFTTGWDANGNKLPDEWELAVWGNTSFRYNFVDDDRDGLNSQFEYALGR